MRGSRAKQLRRITCGNKFPRPSRYDLHVNGKTILRADGYCVYRQLKRQWNAG